MLLSNKCFHGKKDIGCSVSAKKIIFALINKYVLMNNVSISFIYLC